MGRTLVADNAAEMLKLVARGLGMPTVSQFQLVPSQTVLMTCQSAADARSSYPALRAHTCRTLSRRACGRATRNDHDGYADVQHLGRHELGGGREVGTVPVSALQVRSALLLT